VLLYNSRPEDRGWADGGLVAKVVSGDSSLALQQRVEDAGFDNIVVTPMGSNRVFLHISGGGDMWQVFHEANDFFNFLFTDIHKWTTNDEIYERGAWIRVYGTPVHAWNELFFKICVSGCGRFIRSDECTVDKARLDYARVLISTTFLKDINLTSEVVIDGCKYSLKLVEEWGCNLGEDAFMSEEEIDPRAKALSICKDVAGMEEFNGEMDDLVDDLNKEWQKNDVQENNFFNVDTGTQLDVHDNKESNASGSIEHQGKIKGKHIVVSTTAVFVEQQDSSSGKHQDVNYFSVSIEQHGNSHGKHHVVSQQEKQIDVSVAAVYAEL